MPRAFLMQFDRKGTAVVFREADTTHDQEKNTKTEQHLKQSKLHSVDTLNTMTSPASVQKRYSGRTEEEEEDVEISVTDESDVDEEEEEDDEEEEEEEEDTEEEADEESEELSVDVLDTSDSPERKQSVLKRRKDSLTPQSEKSVSNKREGESNSKVIKTHEEHLEEEERHPYSKHSFNGVYGSMTNLFMDPQAAMANYWLQWSKLYGYSLGGVSIPPFHISPVHGSIPFGLHRDLFSKNDTHLQQLMRAHLAQRTTVSPHGLPPASFPLYPPLFPSNLPDHHVHREPGEIGIRSLPHTYMLSQKQHQDHSKFSMVSKAGHPNDFVQPRVSISAQSRPQLSSVSTPESPLKSPAFPVSSPPAMGVISPRFQPFPRPDSFPGTPHLPPASLPDSSLVNRSPRGFFFPHSTSYGARRPRDPNKPPPVKKYKCDICAKAFSRSNTLVTHRRIHTGEKPFQCEVCSRAFRQPGNLTRHRLTHTSVKPYVCVVCKKAFNRASNLHTHMRTHANLSPFLCPYCGKGFQQKVDLKIHMYTHTGHPPATAVASAQRDATSQ